tara:strand:+ start:263 stop:1510 length:1248 start_codon:yes stop_codon:yes gene_type:complete
MPYDEYGNFIPTYDPYSMVGSDVMATDPMARLEALRGRLPQHRQRAFEARSDKAFQDIMAQPQQDRYDSMGRLISEFDVTPGEDDLDFFPAQPAQPAQPGYMGQDPSPGMPGPAAVNIGGLRLSPEQFTQMYTDAEVRSVDEGLQPGTAAVPAGPAPAPTAQQQTLGQTPGPTQEPPMSFAEKDRRARGNAIGWQVAGALGVGAAQTYLDYIPTDAETQAKEWKEQWAGDAPEKEGERQAQEYREDVRAQVNRRLAMGRESQEDIQASMGDYDAGSQQDIRDAVMRAYVESEADLEKNAREIADRVADEKRGMYNSAISYISQLQSQRMKNLQATLSNFAPIAAQFAVNKGVRALDDRIAQLDPEFQEMFYDLSAGATDTSQLARLYAYSERQNDAARARAQQNSQNQATLQNEA